VNSKRITSLGISLAGGDQLQPAGPYQLGIDWIAARNTRLHEPGEGPEGGGFGSGGQGTGSSGDDSPLRRQPMPGTALGAS